MGSRIDLINDMNLPSGDALDALFSSQEERDDERLERVTPIELDMLHDFKNHPFQVRDDEEMARLIDSVKQNGIAYDRKGYWFNAVNKASIEH